tara:strand:+ start:820 stop:972 length:153 start_codon:yes stop_codon:yes gene_type:complete
MKVEIAINIFKGLLLGIRHFDPSEEIPYSEVHIFILMFRIDIFFLPTSEE